MKKFDLSKKIYEDKSDIWMNPKDVQEFIKILKEEIKAISDINSNDYTPTQLRDFKIEHIINKLSGNKLNGK